MNILAIESSCDDTGAAVVKDGREVLSNIVASQVPEHIIYGGVVPEIASRRHCESIYAVVKEALKAAKTDLSEIDAVAVTAAPGLIGALLVGVNFAKGLSYAQNKPLIPVHHLRSHVASNYISHTDLKPPFIALIVSGGHTHLVNVKNYTDYEVIGRTRDDAAGEAMDKAARMLGLPYPGGLNMDKTCAFGDKNKYKFPKPRVDGSEFDFSFSGMKTSVINLIHNMQQKNEEIDIENIGASYMHCVTKVLCEKTQAAINKYKSDKLVIAGGVSANSVLRSEIKSLCEKNKISLYMPELKYCGDNAAMVGAQGYYEFISGNKSGLKLNGIASLDIDSAVFG
ncbi:MAG: tRNA (adenosine(37)-N6)-threonylcarbamoyltransferase complex transferase subunit TsaD [Oscillospiraceae bacterium]|nr:tRNA (adenosine(37)-N6)-threonylcarbamoyltransferase complex transferase subunit TsaD [Oscillospiraceae bacterium]